MIAVPINHISVDERGIAYITGTSMKVSHLAIDAETWGMTPRQIQDNYPQLSPGQIHAALAYYYDHKGAIDAQIAEENDEYERLRAENPNPFTREQLADRWRQRQQETISQ